MSENVPTVTAAKKKLPLYVDDKGRVFKFGEHQPHLMGDYEKQEIIGEPETPKASEVEAPKIPAGKDYDALIYSLSQQIKDLTEKVSQQPQVQAPAVIQAVMPDKKEFGEGVRNIPPDDFDPKGATFVAYGLGIIVSSYMKDGAERLAPYNKGCQFNYDCSDRRVNGKEEHYIHICKFSTKSKKEIEFIRESPQYGISIFESARKVVNSDPEVVAKMASATSMIENLRQDNLFARANSLGIDVAQGYDKVKAELIALTYKELVSQEQHQAEKRANDSVEALFMENKE